MKSKPLVFVTREIAEDALRSLRRHACVEVWQHQMPPPYPELRRRAHDAHAILTMVTDRIDAELIAAAPLLRVVSNHAVGVDNIDVAAATRAGIVVGNTPGVLTETTADLAFALMMAAARRVAEGDRLVRAGKWKTWGPKLLLGQDVFGATLGIIGWGKIGRAMGRRAAGFGMRVMYAQPAGRRRRGGGEALEDVPGARRVTLERLLRDSDFISLHVPLTPHTRHMLGAREFAAMKPGAIVVNTARGAAIDQRALYHALKRGHLGGAGLDVTDPEPLPSGDPILELDNVVITPHIGSASVRTRAKMASIAAENIIEVLQGRTAPYCVNAGVKMRKWKRRSGARETNARRT